MQFGNNEKLKHPSPDKLLQCKFNLIIWLTVGLCSNHGNKHDGADGPVQLQLLQLLLNR